MKNFKLLTIVALFSLSATSQAAVLASPSIYGGADQNIAFCYLFNAGTAPVGITAKQVFQFGSTTPLTLTGNTCGATLAPGNSCNYSVNNISNLLTYACRAVTSTAVGMRGNLEIRIGDGIVLERADMR